MKIVIDIDNESYDHIKAHKNEDVLPMGWYAISHGTPLVSDVPDINDGNINCILDKIRAEIEHLTYYWCEVNPRTVIDDVLQIIDKYNIESEE